MHAIFILNKKYDLCSILNINQNGMQQVLFAPLVPNEILILSRRLNKLLTMNTKTENIRTKNIRTKNIRTKNIRTKNIRIYSTSLIL